jgi:hypothetical protein
MPIKITILSNGMILEYDSIKNKFFILEEKDIDLLTLDKNILKEAMDFAISTLQGDKK